MLKRLVFLINIATFVAAVAAASPLNVQLTLDDDTLLPGTATGLTVRVQNTSNSGIELPPALWIVATKGDGQSFVVRMHNFHDTEGQDLIRDRVLSAKSATELRYDPSPVVGGSPWFMDRKLWAPGSYTLKAVLAADVTPDGAYEAKSAVTSNQANLTISAADPEDAAVWAWMKERAWSEDAWLTRPRLLADFVAQSHPHSAYMLYVAAFFPMPAQDEPAPVFLEQISRNPKKSFTDQLRLLLVHYRQQTSYAAYRQGDINRAAADADAARDIASALAKNSRSANVRKEAAERLKQLPTRKEMVANPKVQ